MDDLHTGETDLASVCKIEKNHPRNNIKPSKKQLLIAENELHVFFDMALLWWNFLVFKIKGK